VLYQKPIAVPAFMLTVILAMVSVPLMWNQIANRTKTMETAGPNLDRNAVVFVSIFSTVVTAVFITLGIFSNAVTMSAIGGGLMCCIILFYFVASFKLAAAIGDGEGKTTVLRLAKLTRRMAWSLVINVVVQGSFVCFYGNQTRLVPLQMIITNLLMPISQCTTGLLLLRFISDSNTRQLNQIAAGAWPRVAGSTAAVAPESEMTAVTTVTTAGGVGAASNV
jgi:hypothetical protein